MKCPKCGKEIAENANKCPECEYNLVNFNQAAKVLAGGCGCFLIIFVILFIVGCFVGVSEEHTPPAIQQQEVVSEYGVKKAPLSVYDIFKDGVLKKGYNIVGDIYYTRSKDFKKVYIFGALVSQNGQIYNCTWANNEENATGMFDSINNYAVEVSGIPHSGNVTSTDDGHSRINQLLLDNWYKLNELSELKIKPQKACSFLESEGIYTNGWKSDGMGGYFCVNKPLMFDGYSNIVYSVEGSEKKATKITLSLNYHGASDEERCNYLFLSDIKTLVKRALNIELPDNFIKDIKDRKDASLRYDKVGINFKKENYQKIKGYNLTFEIKL